MTHIIRMHAHNGHYALVIGSSDWVARSIADAVMQYVKNEQTSTQRHFFITNTDDSMGRGEHWISIGISMRRMPYTRVAPPPGTPQIMFGYEDDSH